MTVRRVGAVCVVAVLGLGALGAPGARAAEPPGYASGMIPVDGGAIFYEIAGSGDPMVLIHDGLLHREVYDGQFPVFAEEFRVVRYDRRGYGRSPKPTGEYSNEDDLLAVMDHCGLEKAVLVGMSMGGGLAIDFALAHPDRVSALVSVGGVVSGFGYTEHFLTRGGQLTAGDYADPTRLTRYFALEDPYEIAPENTAAKERVWALLQANPQNADEEKNRLRKRPARPALGALGEIAVPTLLVVGEHDMPDVHAHAGAIQAGIPGARRVVVPNAGHLVPLEQPDAFNRTVLDFLLGARFFAVLEKEGVPAAVEVFREARERNPDARPFPEGEMNSLGYQHLQFGDLPGAIALFTLNTEAYPASWNVWDSLGEAYRNAGDLEEAVRCYKKSLELDPGNENGQHKLQEIYGEIGTRVKDGNSPAE
jgi:3-oxoadipate enol-lactonase